MKEKKRNTTLRIAIVTFIVLLIIDQVSKIIAICTNVNQTIISQILSFRLIFNKGGAFGVGQGENIGTFIVSNLIVLGIIIRFIWLQKDRMDKKTMYSLFMVLAGGIGNFIDRVFRGQVVDFIEVFPSTHFPIFNLADVYIVLGWIMLAFTFALYSYKEIQARKKEKE